MRVFEAELYRLFSRKNFLVLFLCLLVINASLLVVYSDNPFVRPADYGTMYDVVLQMDETNRLELLEAAQMSMFSPPWLEGIESEGESLIITGDHLKDTYVISRAMTELSHLERYQGTVQASLTELSKRSGISIFQTNDPYLDEASELAISDYEKMLTISPRFVRSLNFSRQVSFVPTYAFTLLLSLLAVFYLIMEDRQIGMERMLLPLAKGRSSLIRGKVLALSLTVLIIQVAFGVTVSLMSRILYGPLDIYAPLQSIPEFGMSGLTITIGQYLVLHNLVSYVGLLLLVLIAMFFAIKVQNVIIVFLAPLALLLASYGLFRLPIDARSLWSPVRFLNLYTFFLPEHLFATYRQLNIAGTPVRSWAPLPYILVLLVAMLVVLVMHTYNRQTLRAKGKRFHLWQRKERLHTKLWRHESYKLAFRASGLLLLILVIGITGWRAITTHAPLSEDDVYYKHYLADLEGELNDEKREYIETEKARFEDIFAKQAIAEERYASGELDQHSYGILRQSYQEQLRPEPAFRNVLDLREHLEARQALGEPAVFLYEGGYLEALGVGWFGNQETMLNGILILLVLGLSLSSFITDERTTDMIRLQLALPYGRAKTMRTKLMVATGYFITLKVVVGGAWSYFIGKHYGFPLLSARAGNVRFFAANGTNLPLWLILLIQVLLSFIAGITVIVLTFLIASYGKDKLWSMLLVTICFALPLGLRYLGVELFDYLGLTSLFHGALWLTASIGWYLLLIPLCIGGWMQFKRSYVRS